MNDIQQSILESLRLVADASVKKSQSTITIETEVLQVVDSGIGSYKVEYMGNKFIAYTNNQSVQYPVGSKVYVVVPDGDFSKEKIIIGALRPNGNMYSATDESISRYLEKSDNLFTNIVYDNNNTIEMCSYRTELNTPIDLGLVNFKSIFKSYLEDYNTLNFSCKIKTNIPVAQRANGNYGLILRLYFYTNEFDDKKKPIVAPKDYIIDINNMIGDPYGFSVWTTQNFYITIDTEMYDFSTTPELYAFVKDFTQSEEEKPYDIFISGISLKVVDTLTDSNLSGYHLSINAQQGEIFLENTTTSYTTLIPELKINGLNTSINGYDCYWFVEDTEIDELSEYYLARAGRGWRCLNERINISNEGGKETFQYKTDSYEYIVKKENVLTSLRYKCVLVYNTQVLSSIIKIKNLDSNVELSLRTSTGTTAYVKDSGEVHLITRLYYDGITNSENPVAEVVYNWTRYSKDGVYLDENTKFCKVIYEDKKIIENGKGYYETEISFPVSYIEEMNTVNCTVKTMQLINSELKTTLVGTESINLSTSANFDFLLNIQNGDVLYKYDADGDSPMVANYDGPESSVVKQITPLSFKMFKRDGTELTEDEYAFCKVKWTISKNSMIVLKTELITDEDDVNYYIEGNGNSTTVNYEILPQYNSSKVDNTVLLEVEFDKKVINAAAAIKFLKDGANGTNGTKHAAVITYNGYGYRERDELGRYRKLQLIYINGEGWKVYDIESNSLVPFGIPQFDINIYTDGQRITDTSKHSVEWSMFDPKATNPCFNITNSILSIQEDFVWDNAENTFCNIIQAKVTVEQPSPNEGEAASKAGEYLYVYYPIEITYLNSADYAEGIIPTLEGGFSSVLYAADGTNPRYDSTFDFVCSDMLYNDDKGNLYDYNWFTSNNLKFKKSTGNTLKITPANKYDNGDSKNYVKVALTLSEDKKNNLNDKLTPLYEHKDELETQLAFSEDNKKGLLDFIDKNKNILKYKNNQMIAMSYWLTNSTLFLDTRAEFVTETVYLLSIIEEYIAYCKKIKTWLINAGYDYENIVLDCKNEIYSVRKAMFTYGNDKFDEEGKKTRVNTSNLKKLTKNLTPSNAILAAIRNVVKTSVYEQLLAYMNNYKYHFDYYNKCMERYIALEETYFDNANNVSQNLLDGKSTPLTEFTKFRYAIKTLANSTQLQDLAYNKDGTVREQNFVNLVNILTSLHTQTGSSDGIESPIYFTVSHMKSVNTYIIDLLLKYIEYKNSSNGETEITISSSYLQTLNIENLTKEKEETTNKIKQLSDVVVTTDVNNIIHIRPIIMTYNRYEMSTINGWDGNKLYTGSNNEGDYLYAPQMGAGKKNEDGTFTGMIMGLRKTTKDDKPKFDVGLFGYASGMQTIFLDAETGIATFGAEGAGQIIISPGTGAKPNATIKGGNYSEEDGTGLVIDLTEPSIKFGSGNFSVSAEGYLTAKGGGSIAGWRIGEHLLTAVDETGKTVLTLDSSSLDDPNLNREYKASFYAFEHSFLENTDVGFYLGPDGLSIGRSIRILEDHMFIGNLKSGHKYWTISANDTNSYISYNTNIIANPADNSTLKNNSVYIGTNGISLGKYFRVANTGILEVGKLNGRHWKIAANEENVVSSAEQSYIFYGRAAANPTLCIDNDSVYIGTDGISLGTKFRVVSSDGTVTVGDVKGTKHWVITTRAGMDDTNAYIAYNTGDFNSCPEMYNDYLEIVNQLSWLEQDEYNEAVAKANTIAEKIIDTYVLTNDCYEIKENTTLITFTSAGKTALGIKNNSVYMGTDGISLGHNKFHVTNKGVLTAKEGHIAGWNFDGNKLFSSSGYMEIKGNGSMKGGTGKKDWRIQKDGDARFGDLTVDDLKANGTGSIAGWKITSTGLKGGDMEIKSEGSMYGPGWSITKEGKATFNSFYANVGGSIAGWSISSAGLKGGSMYINKDGSMGGTNWSITASGLATFNDINVTGGKMNWGTSGFKVNNSGVIDAPSGKLGPWTLDSTGIYDEDQQTFLKATGGFKVTTGQSSISCDTSNCSMKANGENIIGRAISTTTTILGQTINIKGGNVTLESTGASGTVSFNGFAVKPGGKVVSMTIENTFITPSVTLSDATGSTILTKAVLDDLISKAHAAPTTT